MRTATYTRYDFLRKHQRNREWNATDLSDEENDWFENLGEESHPTPIRKRRDWSTNCSMN